MFRVGTGLDSQILGDFEIISNKIKFYTVKVMGLANNFMERLVNAVIQASKKIKTDTEISSEHFGFFCCSSIYYEEC
jgi:glutamyl-tRNA reductase